LIAKNGWRTSRSNATRKRGVQTPFLMSGSRRRSTRGRKKRLQKAPQGAEIYEGDKRVNTNQTGHETGEQAGIFSRNILEVDKTYWVKCQKYKS